MIDGPLDAPLVIVGRDPGWQEVRDGRPFVGAAGHLLNTALKDVGLRREDILICNVVNERPPGDDWDRHRAGAIESGFADLNRLLLRHPRKLVVAAGAQATLTCLTGSPAPARERDVGKALDVHYKSSVSEMRGYCFPATGFNVPVLPIVHPAAVLRQWLPWRATLSWDLAKSKRLLMGVRPRIHRTSRWVADPAEALALARTLAERAGVLAVDSEEPPSACVAFATNPQEGIAFPLEFCWEAVGILLASPVPKVLQNAQYDLTRFKRLGFTVRGDVHDTMLLWHATEPLIAGKADSGAKQTQKGLRFLASVFTDEPFWKDYRFGDETEKWTLCATDARVTLEVWDALQRRGSREAYDKAAEQGATSAREAPR